MRFSRTKWWLPAPSMGWTRHTFLPCRDHQRWAILGTPNLVIEIRSLDRDLSTPLEIELFTNHLTSKALTGTPSTLYKNVTSCKNKRRKSKGKFHLKKRSCENHRRRANSRRSSKLFLMISSKVRKLKGVCSWSRYPMKTQRSQPLNHSTKADTTNSNKHNS